MNLREEIESIYENTYPDSYVKKFSGALTVELIRRALKRRGIPVSKRDVFIENVPIEIDLIIPKKSARPKFDLIYKPSDVLAVLEIKYRGAFGSQGLESTQSNFRRIKQKLANVECIYLTVVETRGYKWAVYRKNLGFRAYTLFWWSDSRKDYFESRDWAKLVPFLQNLTAHERK
jgi:hypothetical protein